MSQQAPVRHRPRPGRNTPEPKDLERQRMKAEQARVRSLSRLQDMPELVLRGALLSVEEVCTILGVSRKIVDQHIKAGELMGVRIGNSRKFRLSDIDEFHQRMAEEKRATREPPSNVVALPAPAQKRTRSGPAPVNTVTGELDRLLGKH